MKLENFIQNPPSAPGQVIDARPSNDGQRDWNPDVQDVKNKNAEQIIANKEQILSELDRFKSMLVDLDDQTREYEQINVLIDQLTQAIKAIDVEHPPVQSGDPNVPSGQLDPSNM